MFYVLDENHNLIEAYDKEGVLSALEQAIADGSLAGITADSAFVSKLRCCVGGTTHRIAFVTQAKYNELEASGSIVADCYYYIIDDTTAEDIDQALQYLSDTVNSLQTQIDKLERTASDLSIAKNMAVAFTGKTVSISEKGLYAVCIRSYSDLITTKTTAMLSIDNLEETVIRSEWGDYPVSYNGKNKRIELNIADTTTTTYTIASCKQIIKY